MNVKLHLSMLFMALLPASLLAQQEPIRLTFAGAGESEQVDQVTVDNLTQGTTLTLDGSSILILNDQPTGIEEVDGGAAKLTRPLLYPNPAETDGNLVFDAPQAGQVSVKIYDLKGALVDAAEVQVENGRNSIRIPTQGHGFFIVCADGAGIHFSQKWMSCAPKSFAGIGYNGLSSIELPLVQRTTRALATAEQPTESMQFTPGDVLRFTGVSGNMKTIVMNKPEMDHTVTFQFFKCQDANGYNYPIVEAGGMLWMAEDLHPVKNSEIAVMKSAAQWADTEANPIRMAYADFNEGNTEQGAYYTPKAAIKAMPAGWKLPTADELKLVQETFGGAEKAAAALKAHGDQSNWGTENNAIDEVQLSLSATGFLKADGNFSGQGNSTAIVTRNFTNGLAHIMKLRDGSDATELKLGLVANAGEGFTVRGVRPAMSPYNGFISNWLAEHPENMPKTYSLVDTKAGLEGNPFAYTAPLGQKYVMTSGPDQFASDKGIEYITDEYDFEYQKLPNNQLHRLTAQSMPNGLQRTVRLSWSNLSNNSNFNETETLEDETLWGSGVIKIEVFGSTNERDFKYEGLVDKNFTLPAPKNIPSKLMVLVLNDYNSISNTSGYYSLYEQYMSSMKAICADFNGDEIDDILLGIGTKIAILDGKDYKTTLFEKDFAENNAGCTVVSCSAGDVNKDGRTDLAVIYEKNASNVLEVWWNGIENFDKGSDSITPLGESKVCHGVLIGDLNEDGNMDVITQTVGYADQQITVLNYVRESNRLDILKSQTFKNNDQEQTIQNSEMLLFHAEGLIKKPMLVADGKILRWNEYDKKLELIHSFYYPNLLSSGSIGAFNFDNNAEGKERLLTVTGAFNPIISTGNFFDKVPVEFETNIRDWNYDPSTKEFIVGYNVNENAFQGQIAQLVIIPGQQVPVFSSYVFSSINVLRYKYPIREATLNSIETTMSEPRIYALLAAAPYWAGYDKYEDEPGTSWGKTKGSGDGTSHETSNTGSMIAGYEHEFTIPVVAIKTGGIDFETRLDWTSTKNQQETTMTEYGIEYNTIYQDGVVLTMVPYTAYNYVITKSGNEDEIGSTLMIGAPDKPRTMLLSLDNYMALRADNTSIPNLRMLFKHEQGNPWSYKKAYVDLFPTTSDILWGDGEPGKFIYTGSGGSTTRSIAVTQEMESAQENEFALDVTLVGTLAGVKAGGGYGYSNKNGIIHKEAVGHTITGSVPNPESITDVKSFGWNVCRANVSFGGQKFPVVTYIVKQ